MHVQTSKRLFNAIWFAYVAITNFSEDSTNPYSFQQCTSDVNDLAYVIGSVPQDGSALNIACFDTIKL